MNFDANSFDLSKLPSAEIKNLSNLPESPGIYFAVDGKDILYIGIASNINARWGGHHRLPDVKKLPNCRIHYFVVNKNNNELKEIESLLIERYQPKLNGSPMPQPPLNVRLTNQQRENLQALADEYSRGNVSALIKAIADGRIKLAQTDQQQVGQLWAEVQRLRTSLIANQRQWVEAQERMDRQWKAIAEIRKSLCK